MDIKELESFKLSDAVKFHDKLNPKLWKGTRLDPAVKKQLLVIAEDFISELGIKGLDVDDITISGSNAAYSYTPHSDLDLHILVDMTKLPDNEVYQELFLAKKNLYNSSHDIKVHGVPVELYVQDTNAPVVSLGEYSVLNDKWLHIPKKRRANFDQNTTRMKFDKLKELVELALKSKSVDRVNEVLKLIKRYRKAGLDKGGEFSPENLAYKAIRTQGGMDQLFALRDKLHSEELTIENMYAGPKMKFLRPGELKGSYTDYDLLRMGFKKAQNGSWYIPQFKWEKLRALNQIGEDSLEEKFAKELEDYHPNAKPRGPEFPPTMPAGTVRVDVSDVYDWYKLGQHVSNLKGLGKHDFGKGPPSTIMAFGSEPEEHKYIKDLEKTGLSTTDIDPVDKNQPKGMKRQKVDPTYNVDESKYTDLPTLIDAWMNELNRYFRNQVSYGYGENENTLVAKVRGQVVSVFDKETKKSKLMVEASGYIPSEKEKNDPRFKSALTVDVKPDSIKKNAKAFSWLTSRAGIPPQARSDGKV